MDNNPVRFTHEALDAAMYSRTDEAGYSQSSSAKEETEEIMNAVNQSQAFQDYIKYLAVAGIPEMQRRGEHPAQILAAILASGIEAGACAMRALYEARELDKLTGGEHGHQA